jgi:DNA-binding CsgD family transcriptional regulator/tetratricopeptide (TPR) repeat protein
VRLFADRAHAADARFELTDDVLPAVARVCARLDGLPLAIELAARQVGVLSLSQILNGLDDRLTLLAQCGRDAPARHHSLRAAIGWSYDLLDDTERVLFRRLAVLPGGFDLDGTAAVCAPLGFGRDELWERLRGLAGKSLLAADTTGTGDGRFRMLESLRIFGRDQLVDCGELDAAHHQVLAWLTELAQSLLTGSADSGTNLSLLKAERHNLRYAVQVAEQTHDKRFQLIALAYQFVAADIQQSQSLLERILPGEVIDSPFRVAALTAQAGLMKLRGDYRAALPYAQQAVETARRIRDDVLYLRALRSLTSVKSCLGDRAAACALAQEGVALARRMGQDKTLAYFLADAAWLFLAAGDIQAATDAVKEAQSPECHDTKLIGQTMHIVGAAALARHDVKQARAHFAIALTIDNPEIEHVPNCIEGLALVAAVDGQPERALRLLGAAGAVRANYPIIPEPWWSDQLDTAADLARSHLTAAQVARAYAEGSTLTRGEAVTYALRDEWPPALSPKHASPLTAREQQVTELVTHGLTDQQIAARLQISARTVATHLEHIRTKLNLASRAQIAAWASRHQTLS